VGASEFTVRLLLLFFPGVICAYIVDSLTIHRPKSQFEFVLDSFVYGLASYLVYWAALWGASHLGLQVRPLVFLHALTDGRASVSFRELAWASFVACLLALCLTVILTHKLHFRLARRLRLTKKFGELDVWGFVFNSPEVEWATVRDHAHGLAYDGWVQLFSDDSRSAELVLRDVKVYRNDTGAYLYEVPSLYLSLNRDGIILEFRRLGKEVTGNAPTESAGRRGQEGWTESSSHEPEAGTASGSGNDAG